MSDTNLIKCKQCGEEKGREDFYWRKSGRISSYTCKECCCALKKAYEQSEAGQAAKKAYRQSEAGKISSKKGQEKYEQSEAGKATRKAYERSEAGRVSHRKYRKTEAGKAADRKYRESEAGKAVKKATSKKWQQSEAGKASRARSKAKRRSKEASTINDLTAEQWLQILQVQDNCCNGCGISFEKVKPCKDHIIPVANGGGLTKENIQALCQFCNSTKGPRSMSYLVEVLEKKEIV